MGKARYDFEHAVHKLLLAPEVARIVVTGALLLAVFETVLPGCSVGHGSVPRLLGEHPEQAVTTVHANQVLRDPHTSVP